MKIYISAQAQHKRDVAGLVQGKAIVIIDHLLKLILMPDAESRHHWQGEIAGQLNRMQRLKGTNKLPTMQEIYKWTYKDNLDYILDVPAVANEIENFCEEYDCTFAGDASDTCETLSAVCRDYFSWISKQLSEQSFVSNREIYKKLDELT